MLPERSELMSYRGGVKYRHVVTQFRVVLTVSVTEI